MLATAVPTARVSPQSHISGCTTRVRNWKGRSAGEVPGRARRPRRGGDVGRSRTPDPAARPGPRRRPARGQRGGHARPCRPSTTRSPPGSPSPAEVAEAGTVLVLGRLLADISRNLPDRRSTSRTDGNKVQVTCGSSPVQPADDAGRRLPDAARRRRRPPAPSPATSSPRPSPRSSIAADRGDTLPILTGVRIEIEGDKITLLATDRYRLAMRELTWNPEATDASHVGPGPGPHPRPTRPRRSARGGSVEIALGRSAGGDGLIGFEAGQRRDDDPAARRRVPQGHLDLPDQRRHRGGRSRPRRWSRRSSASPWSPSATPRCG